MSWKSKEKIVLCFAFPAQHLTWATETAASDIVIIAAKLLGRMKLSCHRTRRPVTQKQASDDPPSGLNNLRAQHKNRRWSNVDALRLVLIRARQT